MVQSRVSTNHRRWPAWVADRLHVERWGLLVIWKQVRLIRRLQLSSGVNVHLHLITGAHSSEGRCNHALMNGKSSSWKNQKREKDKQRFNRDACGWTLRGTVLTFRQGPWSPSPLTLELKMYFKHQQPFVCQFTDCRSTMKHKAVALTKSTDNSIYIFAELSRAVFLSTQEKGRIWPQQGVRKDDGPYFKCLSLQQIQITYTYLTGQFSSSGLMCYMFLSE